MTWKDIEELWDLAHFVGVTRPGHELTDFGRGTDITLMEIPAMAISSTDCRQRVNHGKPVWYLVPDGVVQYIAKHRLYRSDADSDQVALDNRTREQRSEDVSMAPTSEPVA